MPTEPSRSDSAGWVGAVRLLGDGLLASAHSRLALLGTELQEEKLRLIQALLWLSAAVFAAVMTVLCGSLTLVFLFWETARLAVLGGLTLFYAAGLVALVVTLRRRLADGPHPFAGTLSELNADRACIRPRH